MSDDTVVEVKYVNVIIFNFSKTIKSLYIKNIYNNDI